MLRQPFVVVGPVHQEHVDRIEKNEEPEHGMDRSSGDIAEDLRGYRAVLLHESDNLAG